MNRGESLAHSSEPATVVRPFLRWAGGKRWAIAAIRSVIPSEYGRYIEPFVGGGAVFFGLRPPRAIISDLNSDLMDAYRSVRDNPEVVVRRLVGLTHDRTTFERMKTAAPRATLGRAVRLLYLNRLSWNGLYRVNSRGEYNVPFSLRRPFSSADGEVIRAASRLLRSAEITDGDFESIALRASGGDVVFLDPPYTVTHRDNGFLLYNERIFSWSDQERLARTARELVRRGAWVVLTNADHPAVKVLYKGFDIRPLRRNSVLAADPSRRRAVGELLVSSPAS